MRSNTISAIILAAGRSTRMGANNKLLTPWRGKTPLKFVCEAATTSECDKIIVVTGHQQSQVLQAISDFEVQSEHNPDYKLGMASSIKVGILAARQNNSEAVLVLLGDMPGVTREMINEMIFAGQDHSRDKIIVATFQGKRGNPLLWPKKYFDELSCLKGDKGARQIFSRHEDQIVELELGAGVLFDLDTPQAFLD